MSVSGMDVPSIILRTADRSKDAAARGKKAEISQAYNAARAKAERENERSRVILTPKAEGPALHLEEDSESRRQRQKQKRARRTESKRTEQYDGGQPIDLDEEGHFDLTV